MSAWENVGKQYWNPLVEVVKSQSLAEALAYKTLSDAA